MRKTNGKRFLPYAARNRMLRCMGFDSYPAYLASDLWKSIRDRVLERAHGRCEMCHFFAAEQVHHLDYWSDTLKCESLDGLIATCGQCHTKVEFDRGGVKRGLCQARVSAMRRQKNASGTDAPSKTRYRKCKQSKKQIADGKWARCLARIAANNAQFVRNFP